MWFPDFANGVARSPGGWGYPPPEEASLKPNEHKATDHDVDWCIEQRRGVKLDSPSRTRFSDHPIGFPDLRNDCLGKIVSEDERVACDVFCSAFTDDEGGSKCCASVGWRWDDSLKECVPKYKCASECLEDGGGLQVLTGW